MIKAGLVLSPSFLSQINKIRSFFIQDLSAFYYRVFAFISRILFMFLIGLEMDTAYLRTNMDLAATIASGGLLVSFVFGIILTYISRFVLDIKDNTPAFSITITILLANSASPVVMRLIDELKFNTSELGRLASTTSLINEVGCIIYYSSFVTVLSSKNFANAIYSIILTALLIIINMYLAKWFARWNKDSKYVSNAQVLLLLVLVVSLAFSIEIPRIKAVLLAFVLNLKGNFELILIDVEAGRSATWWSPMIHRMLLIVVVLNTLITGPIIASILRRNENYFAHRNTSVESLDPESEFRILSCAYEPRHASGQLVLGASFGSSISPYLMHLVELPKRRRKAKLLYNQLEDGGQYSDEEDYGGNDVLEINEAVDSFTAQTRIRISQVKIVNTFANMYEDVCNAAEDFRVTIIFLPFHKHQRIDQRLENSKEGYRTTNQKILRHAPCSVGVLVHKNQTGFQLPVAGNNSYENVVQHAAMLFFGGADDREALALSKRIGKNSNINLTVIRFLYAAKKEEESSPSSQSSSASSPMIGEPSRKVRVLRSLSRNHEIEIAKDNVFFEEFRLRYVTSGEVGLIERYVNNGIETLQVLREIMDSIEFSLFIVGKGSYGGSVMTTGLSDWEECPELGPVGDLLASSDLDIKSSVLIIQQHRQYTNNSNEDSVQG
ncbi:Cation/H(+) antiporter 2 [Citrus sinensis]|nr:Cation/H(+) antiporter 2 [Citrus sinensis]